MKTSTIQLPGCVLHVCDTGDALADTCFAFEGPEGLVCLEAPDFQPDVDAWKAYLAALGKPVLGVLTPYHVGGADQLGETLATARTVAALAPGGAIHGITEGFKEAFHGAFLQPRPIGRVIPEGALSLGGLDFVIRDEGYGFAVELPAARLSATHLFGADCHSLLPSREAIDAALAQCDALEAAGVRLILSTHHLPEGPEAIPAKRAYLLRVKAIAAEAPDAKAFEAAVRAAFPTLGAEGYLSMTAAALYR